MGYLFQCVVYHRVWCRLNVRVRRDRGVYRLLVYDLDGVQVVLGVKSLGRLEKLLIYNLCFFVTIFKRCCSFLQFSALMCRSLLILLF